MYEAGVAECYGHESAAGDRLRELVDELGLKTTRIDGTTVVMDGTILRTDGDIARHYGAATRTALEAFRARAAASMPVSQWMRGLSPDDNLHPWAGRSFADVLDEVADPVARKYLEVITHSDLATESHLTSALHAVRKVVMTFPGYGSVHSIDGGMGQLPRRLVQALTSTELQCSAQVVRLRRHEDGGYILSVRRGGRLTVERADAVIVALPHDALHAIDWSGDSLRRAMASHIATYDRPGHYLRISILFDQPFWRGHVTGSWFMIDAFGGCCVYDEGARHHLGEHGVLGWLLAGADALATGNADDETIVRRALESLPAELSEQARTRLVEARVHRWAGAVSGQPGGCPIRDVRRAHQPDAVRHAGLFAVGDYLVESNLNGVIRSADVATDLLAAWVGAPRRPDAARSGQRVGSR